MAKKTNTDDDLSAQDLVDISSRQVSFKPVKPDRGLQRVKRAAVTLGRAFKEEALQPRDPYKALSSDKRWKKEGKKSIKKRERAVRGLLTAAGVIQGKQTYSGAGRPRGTYKHGMPIHVYKKMMRDKQAMYQRYQQEQYARLKPKGYTPEQIQQIQQQQTYEELEQQPLTRVERIQERVQEMQQQRSNARMSVPAGSGYKYVQPSTQVPDDELNFTKWSAERTISPNTQQILDRIRRIQNKGKFDNIEQQRRIRERHMVMRSMNLMKAHENMIDVKLDFTGVNPEENILFAPNVFKEKPENNILRNNRRAFGILNTREAGNDLKFF